MAFISVSGVSKSYIVRKRAPGALFAREKTLVRALRNLSFTIEAGELVGCIGPNGAGKSTTVKLLSGILTPDGGEARVDGRVPWRERRAHVSHIGVVFGQRTQLWWDVPILDSFELLRDIYRVPRAAHSRRLEELTAALDLAPLLSTPLRQLSLGQRMRAELAGSLLHSPSLLFLDEPTIGLDAVSKLMLRGFLQKENREHGTTILLTTHDMSDIAALCARVMVLGRGQLLFDGALCALLARYDNARTARVTFRGAYAMPELPPGAQALPGEGGLCVRYEPRVTPAAQVLAALERAGEIDELTLEGMDLDHLVAAMYKELSL